MKEDLFCKERFETVLKGMKNNKVLGADNVVNMFFNYDVCIVRDQILKIMNMN